MRSASYCFDPSASSCSSIVSRTRLDTSWWPPYAHVGLVEELDSETQQDLMSRISASAGLLRAHYGCDGLNIGANIGRAGGAGFEDHLHFHVVPRWSGDHNFMTVVGEIRVIPTHIEHIYAELSERFRELP